MSSNHREKRSDWLGDVFKNYWDLGFTAFGGPPTHFQILHRRFVKKTGWITEEQYKELFALTQSLPGPASTKMAFCIALERSGFIGACMAFLLWNASTVGIVAVAAFQLSERSITDPLSRVIILFTAGAGMLYKALWYFPLLMVISGLATCWWDVGGGHELAKLVEKQWTRIKRAMGSLVKSPSIRQQKDSRGQLGAHGVELSQVRPPVDDVPDATATTSVVQPDAQGPRASLHSTTLSTPPQILEMQKGSSGPSRPSQEDDRSVPLTAETGLLILVGFFTSFITLLVLRAVLHHAPLLLKLYTNMYLAGTIIFGGGPVVIPLLREYVVTEGWVSNRDFLLGLAIIQAFPGPNFNFAVYLAALTAKSAGVPSIVSAILGWVGIFLPGLALATAATSLFPLVRNSKFVPSILRGVNAGAIGLVWTAVYRLWEIGYLTPKATSGTSLGLDP
ncbi:hypothetical protein FRC01_004596, partial [Tulasnella sp. 417]